MVFTEEIQQKFSSPISDEHPCGTYLKNDRASFRPLRNEFNVAQTALRKLAQNPDEQELEALHEENLVAWKQLGKTLNNTFEHQSRDIELIGWMLAVQLIVDDSIDGAANLIGWLNELIDSHWDSLNPVLPAEKLKGEGEDAQKDQYEAKVKAFFQICGDSEDSSLLYGPLLMLPIVGDITFYQYQSAENKGQAAHLRQEALHLLASQKSAVQQRADNLDRLSKHLLSVYECVNKYTQPLLVKGVNFTFALSLIGKVQNAITYLTGLKPAQESVAPTVDEAEPVSSEPAPTESQPQTITQTATEQASIAVTTTASFADAAKVNNMNRDQAFVQLRELAEYFRVSEPHSPVSFLLEKAIRWGYMSLPELMTELMADKKNDQEKIFNLIGLDNEGQVQLPEHSANLSSSSSQPVPQPTQSQAPQASEAKETPQQNSSNASTGSTGLRW
ncbi:hypothetical protein GCE9029_00734 [Grimontia celer]|uniref:ImpA N-terminal domain-containing protein n=1 Tax=Grimontia celer TaxID=1796497 RepID=A0A128EUJ4_9GAMM|nr:type VI secretion system ImpA family N-terminal domain-containing protein [Grimontia celer]CZF78268.1 hypothetical protein GCE9029_00734 [Grimontia celer]